MLFSVMERTLTSHEVARLLGVNIKTVQRWDREGRLKPAGRTDTGRRYYTEDQILAFRHQRPLALMDAVEAGEISTLILADQDRLTRFGYEWFERFCQHHGCEILVLNQEHLSPEPELVQDLLTITHVFSARLSGLRNYRKSLKEAIHADVSPQDSFGSDAGSDPVL